MMALAMVFLNSRGRTVAVVSRSHTTHSQPPTSPPRHHATRAPPVPCAKSVVSAAETTALRPLRPLLRPFETKRAARLRPVARARPRRDQRMCPGWPLNSDCARIPPQAPRRDTCPSRLRRSTQVATESTVALFATRSAGDGATTALLLRWRNHNGFPSEFILGPNCTVP